MFSSGSGKTIRIKRIFKNDGRALISALDHGGEDALVNGLERMDKIVSTVIKGGIDAILINEGILVRYSDIISGNVPVILNIPLRTGFVKNAISLGADAIKTTYFGDVPIPIEIAEKMRGIAAESIEYGIPYVNEFIPMEKGNISNDPILVTRAARAAAEYGADVVKTSYVRKFEMVTEAVPVPVIIAGGEPGGKSIEEVMKDVINKGGAGGAIGRSIFQSSNPEQVVKRLVRIVHSSD
jgi:DhnA family fructose-bisphosphate aldolase class Ia